MTGRDPELLELLHDRPDLLAVADAVATTQRAASRSRGRRLVPRLAVVAAAAAVIVAAALILPDRFTHHGVVERALAAIGNGPVLHLRLETPSGLVFIDLETGRRTVQTYESEIWITRDASRFHYLVRANGRVADVVLPDDAHKGMTFEGGPDPAFAALWTGYREALANGSATVERKGRIDGHDVYWLRFDSSRPGAQGTEVAIDQDTYKPVVFREHSGAGRHVDERVLLFETTDFRASDFRRQGGDLFASGESSSGSASSYPPPAHPRVEAPWLTPGDEVVGLKLISVDPYSATSHGRTIRGVELQYGVPGAARNAPRQGTSPLTITQLQEPDDPELWASIPLGSAAVQEGESGDAKHVQLDWTGSLRKHGIYVTIETTRGERTLLTVANALRPAP